MLYWSPLPFPSFGALAIVTSDTGVQQIRFDGIPPGAAVRDDAHPILQEAKSQLRAYFGGALQHFDLPLEMRGTPFQQQVWKALRDIPYGETRSYAAIAKSIGTPTAMRAVGGANGRNPIPIVVPCHRVIGASGKLVGFGGGLPVKEFLLRLEQTHALRSLHATA